MTIIGNSTIKFKKISHVLILQNTAVFLCFFIYIIWTQQINQVNSVDITVNKQASRQRIILFVNCKYMLFILQKIQIRSYMCHFCNKRNLWTNFVCAYFNCTSVISHKHLRLEIILYKDPFYLKTTKNITYCVGSETCHSTVISLVYNSNFLLESYFNYLIQ